MFIDQRQTPDAQGSWRRWFTIIGVVDDVRFNDLASDSPKMLYLPLDQFWDVNSLRVVVRTSAGASKTASTLRTIVSAVDPNTPVNDIRTYQARIGDLIARPRFTAYLLTAFAAIALLLAAMGVYGVLSFAVSRRIPEIGVRVAFGAKGWDIFGLLFAQGLRLTVTGLLVGIPATIAATRLLSGLLFGVKPVDLELFATVGMILMAVGVAASYLPARRAARIDPIVALRQD
jgi:ABC-type antimicrobial peptide transport system permease subunit